MNILWQDLDWKLLQIIQKMHLAMNLMQTCKDARNGQGKPLPPFQPYSSYPHDWHWKSKRDDELGLYKQMTTMHKGFHHWK